MSNPAERPGVTPGPEPDTTTAAEPDDPQSDGAESVVDGSGVDS
ncbi:hypothetical protein [Microbacterium sp. SORGH_AS_0862]|nr:hypothetical protein [Microbacterium sp. SORGH_AS_0862]MDQ1206328.1 hypothetical protein [Microbacterium sp. SORGH_AS_0862]